MFGKIIYILSSNSYIFGIFEDMILRVEENFGHFSDSIFPFKIFVFSI